MFFYDTNALLFLQEKILKEEFYISSTSLTELENIKISKNKDEDTKFRARKILHILDENEEFYKKAHPLYQKLYADLEKDYQELAKL